MYNDKILKSVAEAVKKVMEAELSSKQKAIAKIEHPKHKIDSGDLAALRSGKKPVKEAASHQARTTMKHIPNPTEGEKQAAKDIKPGVAGYRDRIAMLRSAEARGGLKKEETESVTEGILGKKKPKADRFHIAGSLASYPDKESAIKDRDAKYPGAKVHQVGPRGKIKGEFKEGLAEGKNIGGKPYDMKADLNKKTDKQLDALINSLKGKPASHADAHKMVAAARAERAGRVGKKGVAEEASQEEFTAEIKKTQAKSQGKDKADVAKPAVAAVKQESVSEAMVKGKGYDNPENERKAPTNSLTMTSLMPGHSDKAARFAAVQAKGKLVKGSAQSAKQVEKGMKKEEAEQIDELSKETLKSYQDKAIKTPPSKKGSWVNRIQGIGRAEVKMKKEEVEQIDERTLSEPETAEKERLVKSMKKNLSGFKQRYGERAKSVMYATATARAKENK